MPSMKEAIVAKGPKVTIQDAEIPEPKPDQVVIKVIVSGSNPKDWYVTILFTSKSLNPSPDPSITHAIPLPSPPLPQSYIPLTNPQGKSPNGSPTTPPTPATTSPASSTASAPPSGNSRPATASPPSTKCCPPTAPSPNTPSAGPGAHFTSRLPSPSNKLPRYHWQP